jgi:heme A synthase
MNLPQWHGSPVLLILTLVGDVLCFLLALFGDATGRHRMPHIFWWILWLAQIPLAIQAAVGMALLAGGAQLRTPYHLMYSGLIVLTLLVLYGLRPAGALRRMWVEDERRYRESRWLMLLSLFLAALVGRAYMTGVLGR